MYKESSYFNKIKGAFVFSAEHLTIGPSVRAMLLIKDAFV